MNSPGCGRLFVIASFEVFTFGIVQDLKGFRNGGEIDLWRRFNIPREVTIVHQAVVVCLDNGLH